MKIYYGMNKMFRRIFGAVVILVSSFSIWATDEWESTFTYERGSFAGFNLNYRKADVGDSAKIIVLYLHGGSGQGDDNEAQMKTPAIMEIYNYLKGKDKSFTMFVPQAPYGQQWMGSAIPALKEMLDKYSDTEGTEVYILGASMGGLGTWNMLSAYPGYFTAAMPVAVDTPSGKVDPYLETRIYSVVGGDDRRRNIGKCKSFFKKLTEHGGEAKLDVENSWGHRQTCEKSFTPERLDWLFSRGCTEDE